MYLVIEFFLNSIGSELVLVACDGVQHSPVFFPTSSSLFQFLGCLETGLEPEGKLEPALVELEQCPAEREDVVFKIMNTKSNGKFWFFVYKCFPLISN
jgi:hypothetical protein